MKRSSLKKWEVLDRRNVLDASPWIEVDMERIKLPDGRVVENYYQIRLMSYVIMAVFTTQRRLLMLRQYRHGDRRIGLALPGGLINTGESPLRTAQRELLEETGYVARRWKALGNFVPNSNYGCGRAFLFTASEARQVAEPCSGDLEEMEILPMPLKDVRLALRRGEIMSLSTAAALGLVLARILKR